MLTPSTLSSTATIDDGEPAISLQLHHPDSLPPAEELAKAMRLTAEFQLLKPRKVSRASYLSHSVVASGLVLKANGSVRGAIIALLHDVVEEGGETALAALQGQFSESVCTAVAQMTPPLTDARLKWQERKERGLDRMRAIADLDVAMAFAADKAATLIELELDCQHFGSFAVINKLRGGCEKSLWYYQSCGHALATKLTPRMESLLKMHIECLRRRVKDYPCDTA